MAATKTKTTATKTAPGAAATGKPMKGSEIVVRCLER